MGQKIKKNAKICPKCDRGMTEVGHQDHHQGEYEVFEYHCPNRGGCGYTEDAYGNVRNEGREDLQTPTKDEPQKRGFWGRKE